MMPYMGGIIMFNLDFVRYILVDKEFTMQEK